MELLLVRSADAVRIERGVHAFPGSEYIYRVAGKGLCLLSGGEIV
jgi:hypothetical protein